MPQRLPLQNALLIEPLKIIEHSREHGTPLIVALCPDESSMALLLRSDRIKLCGIPTFRRNAGAGGIVRRNDRGFLVGVNRAQLGAVFCSRGSFNPSASDTLRSTSISSLLAGRMKTSSRSIR